MYNDLRFAPRQLRKNPGFKAVAVLTLDLGISANTAVFTIINAITVVIPGAYLDPEDRRKAAKQASSRW
jgi:hypothetical protein